METIIELETLFFNATELKSIKFIEMFRLVGYNAV
jgi:hypothetical protein